MEGGWSIRSFTKMVSNVKQLVTGEYSEIEWKVRQLTNSDEWGCSPTDMQSFLDEVHGEEDRHEVLEAIKRRLQDGTWRNRYKSLNLLDHIIKHGSDPFLRLALEQKEAWLEILGDLKESYEFVDERSKDQGINVRVKSGSIIELLQDSQLLVKTRKEEQEKRELMLKRRQEFKRNGTGSEPVYSGSSATESVDAFRPNVYEEVRGTPSTHGQQTPPFVAAADDFDLEFDDFQSAPSSTVQSPVEQPAKSDKPVDPFEDLLKL